MAKFEIKLDGKVIGFYDNEVIVQTPRQVKVFGSFDTSLAPKGGGSDALHSFQSRRKDNFGGRMNDAVQEQLKDFYNKGINPQVQSIKIDMSPTGIGPVVTWEVIIAETRDNKAWVGFNSRGASGPEGGANGSIKRAETQVRQKKQDLPKEVGEKAIDMEFTDIYDYRNPKALIRQIFWTYTRPKSYPPKKGSNQAPPTGPQGAQGSQGAQPPTGNQGAQGAQGAGGGKFEDDFGAQETPTSYFDESTDPSTYAPDQEFPPADPSLTSYDEDNIVQASDESPTQYDDPEEVTEQSESRSERTGQGSEKAKELEEKKSIKNIFPNKRKPRSIKIDLPKSTDYQKEFIESFGNLPIIWYNGFQIQLPDIINLSLSYEKNLPTLKITFNDTFGVMKDKGMPLDDSRIAIFINSRTSLLKPIHIDFKIINYSHSGDLHSITGVIDVPPIYIKKFQTYSNLTSYKLYEQIAKDSELGFNTNIDDTDDKMIWINSGNKVHDYMNIITKHTYKSDATYLVQFIDYYYNLNFVDVEKEMSRDIAKELGVGNIGLEDISKFDPPEALQRNYLTNAGGFENTNVFYKKYTVINNSTKLSLLKGYLTKIKFYDQKNKSILVFDVDAITSSPDEQILLRGAPKDDSFFKENIDTMYAGKLDTDNVHKNYYYAVIQNKINYLELSKIQIVVELKSVNFNFYMYQKIIVHVSEAGPSPVRSEWNNRLTGQWLITDISFKMVDGAFSQVMQLNRRDLGLSPEERKNGTFKNPSKEGGGSTSDRGNNPNPVDQEAPLAPQSTGPETPGIPEPQPKKPTSKSSFPKENILEILKACTRHGITNVFSRKAILGIASKESPQLKPETSYANTSPARIREVFPSKFGRMGDAEIDRVKKTDQFWEIVYGGKYGNNSPGDGAKYRGRGFNQITFKGNYESLQQEYVKQGSKLGSINIINNPELLAQAKYAAEFFILFMTKSFGRRGVPINQFTDLKTAVFNFTRANAGWGTRTTGPIFQQGYGKAYAFAQKLTDADVKDSPA